MNKKKLIIVLSSIIPLSAVVIASVFIGFKIKDDSLPVYTVSFDTKGGSAIESIEVKEGKKIPKPTDPTKTGYHVKEWMHGNRIWLFDTDVVKQNITLVTSWEYDRYVITYNFAGGTYEGEYKTTYDVDTEYELIRPSKDGSVFGGWFDSNGQRIDRITKGMTGHISITAKWLDNLVISNPDKTKGEIVSYVDEVDQNKVTVKMISTKNMQHLFNGWFDDGENLLSEDTSYSFTLNNEKVTYITVEYMNEEQENNWNVSHGVFPRILEDNKTIEYGMYPQNNVNDETLLKKLANADPCEQDGYYYFDHEYYYKKAADLYTDGNGNYLPIHNFDNGDEIIDGQEYWFKVEPIEWRILESKSNEFTILSNILLDVVDYYRNSQIRTIDDEKIYPNNYKYSDLRHWLNGNFLNGAFCFNKSHVLQTKVINDASTTDSNDNKNICENTLDYVFELSYKDYQNKAYGFDETSGISLTRSFKTTDLARSRGAHYGITEEYAYRGYIWTRSPFSSEDGLSTSKVTYGGVLNHSWCGTKSICVQPCIKISL